MPDLVRIMKRIDSYENDMVRLQIELSAIPALAPENGGDGEYEKALFLKKKLVEFGFSDIESVDAPDSRVSAGVRPNIIAGLKGAPGNGAVWIFTHMDVVPPGEISLWDKDPFRGYSKDGMVYGLGTEDNQQDLVSSLFAARAFIDEGIAPARTVGLAFLADEEVGSVFGMEYLAANRGGMFGKSDLLVAPDYGDEQGSVIEIAEKSMLWLRFKTSGRQCHASKPQLGRNAFRAASYLVVSLNDLYRIFDRSDPVYRPDASTFEPTRKDANVPNVNTIPGEDIFYLDCRVLPSYPLEQVCAEIRKMADDIEQRFGVKIEISPVQQVQAPPPTPADAPVVMALQKAVREVYSVSPSVIGIGGGTVAAPLRRMGYPIAVWSRIGHTGHQPNEHCVISNMIGNAKVYAMLFSGV
ncbi:MAG: M20 family metallo-hydrolase [Syntrophaceae bacterium]